jgi:hypothetical protein
VEFSSAVMSVVLFFFLNLWLKFEGVVSSFDNANCAFGNSTLCAIELFPNMTINTQHIYQMQSSHSSDANCIPQVGQE